MDTLALPAARFLLPHVSSQRFEKIGPILKSQRPQPLLSSVCYLRMESSLRQASINSGVRSVIDSTAAMKLVAASRIPFFSKLSCFFCTPQGLGVGLRARSRSDAVFGSLRKTKGEVYVQHGAKRSFICRAYKNPSSDSQSPLQQERAPTTPLDQLYPSNGATDASSLEESRPLSDKSEDDFADTIGENGKPLHFENAVVEPPPRLRSKRYRNNVLWLLGLRLQLKREIEKVLKSELSRRVVVTMFFLALSRVGQCVLLPGFDRQLLTASRGPRGGDAAGLEELLQSGIPVNLFHIGLFPFIFASVFVEALVELKAVESWSKLKEEGRQGMEKLKEYIWRISGVAAVVFGAGQAVLLRDFSVFSSSSPVKYYFWTTAWLALGAIIYHWIGDRITEDGFGHGTTVLISCSIITASTDSLAAMFRSLANLPPSSACFLVAVWALCFLGMTAGAAVLLGAKRDVELEYFDADFVEGGGGEEGLEGRPYVPFPLTPDGVAPVFYTYYVLALPTILQSVGFGFPIEFGPNVRGPGQLLYHALFMLSVILFSGVDTANVPGKLSQYMVKIGARVRKSTSPMRNDSTTIQRIWRRWWRGLGWGLSLLFWPLLKPFGIDTRDVNAKVEMVEQSIRDPPKPGEETERYLQRVQRSARFTGGVLLAILSVASNCLDNFLQGYLKGSSIGFTSMLIIVGSVIAMKRTYEAYQQMPQLEQIIAKYKFDLGA